MGGATILFPTMQHGTDCSVQAFNQQRSAVRHQMSKENEYNRLIMLHVNSVNVLPLLIRRTYLTLFVTGMSCRGFSSYFPRR